MADYGPLEQELEYAVTIINDNEGLEAALLRGVACVAASLYADLVISGADVGSFAAFYADNVNAGYIRAIDTYVKKKKLIVARYGGRRIVKIEDYDEFIRLMTEGEVTHGVVRISTVRWALLSTHVF